MIKCLDLIGTTKLMPALTIDNVENALPLAQALINAGQPIAEITMRTPEAEECIEIISKETDLVVGAGTVLTMGQAKRAIEAGAKFIVSPGLDPTIIKYVHDQGLDIIPGVATPTEVQWAMSFGIRVMKFFPADLMGGVKFLKALEGPYFPIKFIPMGGINNDNFKDYLSCKNVFALGGPWMAKQDDIKNQNFKLIENNIKWLLEEIKKS